ncbi:hypothetical protein BDZ89DRAFT_1137570 [Hymenopellis radicata]|nr:hypothetical protein BDZ89DRAFT_1137570 [Hymenopellis radicata]
MASPQSAAITELTGSGLSPSAFWLLLCFATASSVYSTPFHAFGRGYIVASPLERHKEAKGSLKDILFERLTDQQRVVWDQMCCLVEKIHDLRRRDYQTRQGGVGAFVRALKGLYKEARPLSAETDEVKLKFDQLA